MADSSKQQKQQTVKESVTYATLRIAIMTGIIYIFALGLFTWLFNHPLT